MIRIDRSHPIVTALTLLLLAATLAGCSGAASGPNSPVAVADDAKMACRALDVSALLPVGSSVLPDENNVISPTEFSNCAFYLDANHDGVSNGADGSTDFVFVTGGLLEKLTGGDGDPKFLDDPKQWANTCFGSYVDTEAAPGFTRGIACSENGKLVGVYYLLISKTVSGAPATLACGVSNSTATLQGREASVQAMCESLLRGVSDKP